MRVGSHELQISARYRHAFIDDTRPSGYLRSASPGLLTFHEIGFELLNTRTSERVTRLQGVGVTGGPRLRKWPAD